MRVILAQDEIEQAIRNLIIEQVNVPEDMRIDINMKATRGDEGYTAEVDIVSQDSPSDGTDRSIDPRIEVPEDREGLSIAEKVVQAKIDADKPRTRGRPPGAKNKSNVQSVSVTEKTDNVDNVDNVKPTPETEEVEEVQPEENDVVENDINDTDDTDTQDDVGKNTTLEIFSENEDETVDEVEEIDAREDRQSNTEDTSETFNEEEVEEAPEEPSEQESEPEEDTAVVEPTRPTRSLFGKFSGNS